MDIKDTLQRGDATGSSIYVVAEENQQAILQLIL